MFGRLRDLAGWRERNFDPTPTRLALLKARIAGEDAALGAALEGPGVQISVNKALVRGDAPLEMGAEVAFLPPMSGG